MYNVQRRVFQNTVQSSALQAHFYIFFLIFCFPFHRKKRREKKQSRYFSVWINHEYRQAILVPTDQLSTTDPSESPTPTNAINLTHHNIPPTITCQRINIKRILFHLNLNLTFQTHLKQRILLFRINTKNEQCKRWDQNFLHHRNQFTVLLHPKITTSKR